MPRLSSSASGQMTQAELAELLPLLPALTKAMTRRSHEVPPGIKADWHGHGLAPRHMNLLVALALAGPMSVSELSTRLDVGLRLQPKGYVPKYQVRGAGFGRSELAVMPGQGNQRIDAYFVTQQPMKLWNLSSMYIST